MDRTIRIAIVGSGLIGRVHAKAISKIDNVKLVAVSSRSQSSAAALATDFGCNYYTDYRRMFEKERVDLVSVCTPSGTRIDVCDAAVSNGINILVEKPLDITAERCRTIIEMCESAGVKLGTVFQMRFQPAFQRVREAVLAGKFGRLILGNAKTICYRSQEYYDQGGWRGTWEQDGGGALMNQGIHTVDVLRWIMGDVNAVSAYAAHLTHDIEVEDTVSASVKFANGAFGSIQATTSVGRGIDKQIEIYGEKGTVIIDGANITTWDFEEETDFDPSKEKKKELVSSARSPVIEDVWGHQQQITDMVNAIRSNAEPVITGEDGLRATQIVEAIYRSAKTGKQIVID